MRKLSFPLVLILTCGLFFLAMGLMGSMALGQQARMKDSTALIQKIEPARSSNRNIVVDGVLQSDSVNIGGALPAGPIADSVRAAVGGPAVDQTARDTAAAAFNWAKSGSYVQTRYAADTVKIGTVPASLNQMAPGVMGWTYPQFRPKLWVEKGLGIFPDAANPFNTSLNVYMDSSDFAYAGGNIYQKSETSGKFIPWGFMDAVDVVQAKVGPDSLRPLLVPWGYYDSNNVANDLVGVVMKDFTTSAGTYLRGQLGFTIVPPNVGVAITLGSPALFPSARPITGIHRSADDSTNSYVLLTHGQNADAVFEINKIGAMTWYADPQAGGSPFTGVGMKLVESTNPTTTLNQPRWEVGSMQIQAKRSADTDYAYATVGFDAVKIVALLGLYAPHYRTTDGTIVINSTHSFVGDSSLPTYNYAGLTGDFSSGYYFRTQSVGDRKLIAHSGTHDAIGLGDTYLEGISVGLAPQAADLLVGKNRMLKANFMRFMDSGSNEKFKVDSSGNMTLTGKIGNSYIGLSPYDTYTSSSFGYASDQGTTITTVNGGGVAFAIWSPNGASIPFAIDSDDTIRVSAGFREVKAGALTIAGNDAASGYVWTATGSDGKGHWAPSDTTGGGGGGDTAEYFIKVNSGVPKYDSVDFRPTNTIGPISEDDSNYIEWHVDTSYIETKYGTQLANGKIFVGNASSRPIAQTMSGQATLDNAGVLTIGAGAITLANMANLGNGNFIGRITGGTGVPEAVTSAQLLTQVSVPIFDVTDPGATNIFTSWDDVGSEMDFSSAAAHKALLSLENVENLALSGITFTAGDGLQGGGTLAANRTFTASPKATGGLVNTSDSLAVDSTKFPATDYDVSLKLNIAALDTGTVLYWPDTTDRIATNYDLTQKLSLTASTVTEADSPQVLIQRRVSGTGGATQDTVAGIDLVDPANGVNGTSEILNVLASPAGTTGQQPTMQADGTIEWASAGGNAPIYRVTIADPVLAALTWTNMPAALSFWMSTATVGKSITKADLTNFTEVRLHVNKQATSGAASSKLIFRYLTTFTQTAASWLDIGTSEVSVATNNTNTFTTTSWIPLAAGAKADVFITLMGSGGDGAVDPAFGMIVAEFR